MSFEPFALITQRDYCILFSKSYLRVFAQGFRSVSGVAARASPSFCIVPASVAGVKCFSHFFLPPTAFFLAQVAAPLGCRRLNQFSGFVFRRQVPCGTFFAGVAGFSERGRCRANRPADKRKNTRTQGAGQYL
jgi:hypothetical protein